MRRFAALYEALDSTTSTNAKTAALTAYFRETPAEDAAWTVFFLGGERLKRLISGRMLRAWAAEAAGLPPWLVEDAHAAVGDSAETVALLVAGDDAADESDLGLARWIEDRILPLRGQDAEHQRLHIAAWWAGLGRRDCFVLNKLLTGAFRVGVSRTLVVRALARAGGLEPATVAHRLMGGWRPSAAAFAALIAAEDAADDRARPYPFFLASALEGAPDGLGPVRAWCAEWKWDGIRAQLLLRGGEVHLWSRGEEAIVRSFPEIREAAASLPDGTVLDGEILAWDETGVRPFAVLQRRLGRDDPSARIRKEAPVRFLAYDLLEADGEDLRGMAFDRRRRRLETMIGVGTAQIGISALLAAESWDTLAALREESRARGVEGLMLKRAASPYGVGRRRGDWWKWKVAPLTIDAVLVYSQAGSGRRANLFTDHTFAVWRGDELVPIAKAYSGLTDTEMAALDRWIRTNTVERFGPVRRLTPHHVFELAFEAVQPSPRHKSGLALRFPRIRRWRTDKPAAEADRLETLQTMIPGSG